MNIIKRIRSILANKSISAEDKLIEIHSTLPKESVKEYADAGFGLGYMQLRRVGRTVIFDGGDDVDHTTDTPLLKNEKDFYYSGCGCTWGVDLEGNRYWKRYHPSHLHFPSTDYNHLKEGDIVNEQARIDYMVKKSLEKFGVI
jgi:hypothetical protein